MVVCPLLILVLIKVFTIFKFHSLSFSGTKTVFLGGFGVGGGISKLQNINLKKQKKHKTIYYHCFVCAITVSLPGMYWMECPCVVDDSVHTEESDRGENHPSDRSPTLHHCGCRRHPGATERPDRRARQPLWTLSQSK